MSVMQNEKGKRRQNAACDSCKLRRVKCDLVTLQEVHGQGASLACTPCSTKGIQCTTLRNQNKTAPRRTGVRIEAAKRQHGELGLTPLTMTTASSSQISTPFFFPDLDGWTSSGLLVPTPVEVSGHNRAFDFDFAGWSDHPVASNKRQRLDFMQSQLEHTDWSVDRELSGKALSIQLSRILIREYFDSAHYQTPAIDPEDFLIRFRQAGEMTEHMGPSEATCAMLECWGARYTTNPVVLGMNPDDSIHDITAGNPSRLKWGVAREPMCRALLERARSLLDKHGIMRKPSIEGIQAMLLLQTMLNSYMDMGEPSRDSILEHRALLSAIASHSEALELRNVVRSESNTVDGELQGFLLALTIPASRVYRTAWINDAISAAAARTLPHMHDEQVSVPYHHILNQSSSTVTAHEYMASLREFIMCFMTIASIARYAAEHISQPANRPGLVDVDKLCVHVRKVWADFDRVSDVIRRSVPNVAKSAHLLPRFSPLNWLTNMRSCICHVTLVVHSVVREQFEFQQRFKSRPDGSIGEMEPRPPSSVAPELLTESTDYVLKTARNYALFIKSILTTDLVAHAGVVLRGLAHVALALSEIACSEQGYPPTTAGMHWTWKQKQREVGWCLDGLYQMGWAWGDVAEVISMVHANLERTTHVDQSRELQVFAGHMSHSESAPFMAFYPPPQVIPSFSGVQTDVYPAPDVRLDDITLLPFQGAAWDSGSIEIGTRAGNQGYCFRE